MNQWRQALEEGKIKETSVLKLKKKQNTGSVSFLVMKWNQLGTPE